jgi:hypothetical protein
MMRKIVAYFKVILHRKTWPINKKAGKKPQNWRGWPKEKQFALVITHDVETLYGYKKVKKLIDVDKKFGLLSCFNFVPKRYEVEKKMLDMVKANGFEVGVHGLYHDGKLFFSKKIFNERCEKINYYLKKWGSSGFYSPSTIRNLDWLHSLNIEYDSSTFDTDPFEPQPTGTETIFPFRVYKDKSQKAGYIEIPYTLSQDFTLFIILQKKNNNIWKEKLDWVAKNGGMVHLRTHPDYMNFDNRSVKNCEYPVMLYVEFLEYIRSKYRGKYWNVLPKDICKFWKKNY